jgi:glycosyltransferase involved in cell wall biosynthesis
LNIIHICLLSAYTENLSYDENLLPEQNARDGHNVTVIADCHTIEDGVVVDTPEEDRTLADGIRLIRIKYDRIINGFISGKIRKVSKLEEVVEKTKPDVIFFHGVQGCALLTAAKYKKNHPDVKLYADNHADFSNSATNWLSKNVLHRIIWRYYAKKAEPYVDKFYGVLPARCDFLHDVYGIPREKIELLVMGGDDEKIHPENRDALRTEICKRFGFAEGDFIAVSGGKLDRHKNIPILLDAFKRLDDPHIKLILFGSIAEDMKQPIETRLDNGKVKYIGWIDADKAYDYFIAADLAVFPGRHSVLWEQAVACGIPGIFKHWEGTHHVDVGGNCEFLYRDSAEEIAAAILRIVGDPKFFGAMRESARRGASGFLYRDIAKKAVGCAP